MDKGKTNEKVVCQIGLTLSLKGKSTNLLILYIFRREGAILKEIKKALVFWEALG
jgi:hypothetical protein